MYAFQVDIQMDNCPLLQYEDMPIELTVEADLSEEEIRKLKELAGKNLGERDVERLNLKESLPVVYKKLNDAAVAVCDKFSYQYALINRYTEDQIFYDNERQMMEIFEADGLFVFDEDDFSLPDGVEDPKYNEFCIWLEEYFFDLPDEEKVKFIEKYYGYTATRLTKEELRYEYRVRII